jgi:hypothetical protein
MRKMQEKSKMHNIQGKSTIPPQTKPYGWQTPIPPANQQIEKNQQICTSRDKQTRFSERTKDKRKTKQNYPGFEFKPRQVNDSS